MRSAGVLLFVATIVPLAAGASPWLVRALLGLDHDGPHACVCPLGPDGSCLCAECIRLHIHDRTPSAGEEEHHDGVSIRAACEDSPASASRARGLSAIVAAPLSPSSPPRVHLRRGRVSRDRPADPPPSRLDRPPRLDRSAQT